MMTLQGFENADLRKAAGATTTQYESDLGTVQQSLLKNAVKLLCPLAEVRLKDECRIT
jgi:hypothetical protein